MKFGIFDHLEQIPGTSLPRLYKQRLELIKLAEQGGITGYHLAEHHGTDLCTAPIQETFLAAAAAVTTTIRIGPLVKCLPLHHPLRIIEDICILDNLSDGRVDFGVGRGIVPSEHLFFDHRWQDARERFDEVLSIVIQGLRTGKIDSEGRKFFDFPPIETTVMPLQAPNPPVWYPGDPTSAGRRGMACLTFSRITPESRARYLDAWEEHRDDPDRVDGPNHPPIIGTAEVVAIASSTAEARDIATRGQAGLLRRIGVAHEYDQRNLSPEEFELALGVRRWERGNRPEDAAARDLFGSAPAGTLEEVRDYFVEYAEEGNCDYVAMQIPTGDMTHEEAMHTLEQICEHILPAVEKVSA